MCSLFYYSLLLFSCQSEIDTNSRDTALIPRAYYINSNGNDTNDGSALHPWKTISKIKDLVIQAGDSVLLKGGQTFAGSLIINYNTEGAAQKLVVIASYGSGIAIVNSTTKKGIIINNSSFILLKNIKVIGAGRKTGNTTDGVSIAHCNNITIDNLDISGYQKSGLHIRNCKDMNIQNVFAYNNGSAGISVDGENFLKTDCHNIDIKYCRAENNPGDPTNLNNHSGNGIILSQCTNAKISYCTSTNNGWDMPRKGNGPVGIWAWEADSITIEHCLSYRNKTSAGGEDGGGFDFDGGITNSVLQYCLSYENEGSGIGLFQYSNASVWKNNTIRYNISINDGNVSSAKAGIFIWNLSANNNLQQCFIYNNTIYNNKNAAVNYSVAAANKDIFFYNNIFVGNTAIISGADTISKYFGNCWYSLTNGFNVNGITNFDSWRNQKHQEILNSVKTGLNIDPAFANINTINITDAKMLTAFLLVKATNPILLNGGIDIQQLFNIPTGGKDFNGNAVQTKGVGASF
ncbi:MAG: right-handed parallel beta-helix repeat-containing protein [Ferruginibacter sp.]